MGKTFKILIADDHVLIRSGLRQILEAETEYSVIEAENGKEALKIIREGIVDLAILDIEMPEVNGFDVAKKVHQESIMIDLIFLTMYKEQSMFNNAMDIGVKGYVLKENTITEIVKCVKTVLSGSYYLSPSISELLIKRNNQLASPAADSKGLSLLTPTEKKILKLVSDLKTSQEMADEFGVSIKTIQNHRNNICHKLGISGTHALLKFAMEHYS